MLSYSGDLIVVLKFPILLEPRNRDGRYTMERVVEEDNMKDNLDTG